MVTRSAHKQKSHDVRRNVSAGRCHSLAVCLSIHSYIFHFFYIFVLPEFYIGLCIWFCVHFCIRFCTELYIRLYFRLYFRLYISLFLISFRSVHIVRQKRCAFSMLASVCLYWHSCGRLASASIWLREELNHRSGMFTNKPFGLGINFGECNCAFFCL